MGIPVETTKRVDRELHEGNDRRRGYPEQANAEYTISRVDIWASMELGSCEFCLAGGARCRTEESMRRLPLVLCLGILVFACFAAPASATHVQCGDTITEGVVLDSDLLNCPGDGLIITATNATIDLNGHSVVGSGTGTGLTIARPCSTIEGSVVVENGSVSNFTRGAFISGDGCDAPIDVRVEKLVVDHNGVGILSLGGHPNPGATAIQKSSIVNNIGDGIFTAFVSPFYLVDNRIVENGSDGILAFEDSLRLVSDNFVARNGGLGARLEDTVAIVTGNTFFDNGGTGLSISERICDFSGYLVADNVADRNGNGGISVAESSLCDPLPQPPPGSGNAAKLNVGFQCQLIVCAKNRGQAKKLDSPPSLASLPFHSR